MAGPKRKRDGEKSLKTDPNPPSSVVTLHRTRLADWRPAPLVHLATSQDGTLAVAVRDNGEVEFYDLQTPYCMRRVAAAPRGSLTCCAILDSQQSKTAPRVFVSGFSGMITELDCDGGAPLARTDSHGGAVWAMAVRPEVPAGAEAAADEDGSRLLAVASEDGATRLFRVTPGVPGATYERTFASAGGRVTALAWHPSGTSLASAGVDGAIRVRDAASGAELARISLRTAGAAADLVVWSLAFLRDGTVVAGDSSGCTSFWDGTHGTLRARFHQHQADVLSVAASPDGSRVWAAGVDPAVAMFRRQGARGRWGYVATQRPHSHDVRALAVADTPGPVGATVLSAGNDALVQSTPVRDWHATQATALERAPQRPLVRAVELAGRGGRGPAALAAVARDGAIRLWRVDAGGRGGAEAPGADGQADRASASGPTPTAVAVVSLPGADAHVEALALAYDAERDAATVAFADGRRTTVLRVRLPGTGSAAAAVEHVPMPEGTIAAHGALFVRGAGAAAPTLVLAGLDGALQAVELGEKPALQSSRAVHDLRFKLWAMRERGKCAARFWEPALQHLTASPDGRYLAFTFRRRLQLVDARAARWGTLVSPGPEALPGGAAAPQLAGLAFSADSATLLSLARDRRLARRSVPSGVLLPQDADAEFHDALAAALKRLGGGLLGVLCHPADARVILAVSTRGVCTFDPAKPAPRDGKRDRYHRGQPNGHGRVSSDTSNFRVMRYPSSVLLDLSFAGPHQLLSVR